MPTGQRRSGPDTLAPKSEADLLEGAALGPPTCPRTWLQGLRRPTPSTTGGGRDRPGQVGLRSGAQIRELLHGLAALRQ
eukprot:9731982-Alexandrium_andersonii.AAC.1